MKKTRVATKLMFAATIISLLCVSLGLLSVGQLELRENKLLRLFLILAAKYGLRFR